MVNMVSFSEQQLPVEFSIGASGGPEYSTNILTMSNGAEQRNINWRYGRARYDLYPAIKNEKMLDKLIEFFRAHRGRAIGFRFKDWTDFSVRKESIVRCRDNNNQYQLMKCYGVDKLNDSRVIKKPVPGSVKIYVNNRLVDFECDHTTGQIMLKKAAKNNATLNASFEFDLPVRFDTDHLDLNLEVMAHKALNIPVVELI